MTFHDVPRPKPADLTVLEPDFKPSKNALERIKPVFRAFKAHSKAFRFQFVDVSPHLGDYKLIYEATNQEIHVEDKSDHCNLTVDEQRSCSIMQHYQYAMGHTIRIVFSVKAQWSFLFTRLDKQSRQEALFIPRDDIPIEWWNAEEDTLTWILNERDGFDKYLVDTASGERMVQDMERILLGAKSMRATKPIPMPVFDLQSLQDGLCEREIAATEEQLNHTARSTDATQPVGAARDTNFQRVVQPADVEVQDQDTIQLLPRSRWSTAGFQRGFGSSRHEQCRHPSDEQWAAEALMELCRKWFACRRSLHFRSLMLSHRRRGHVLDSGKENALSRFVIVEYSWSLEDVDRYDRYGEPPLRIWRCHKHTPVVPIQFLNLRWRVEGPPRGWRDRTFSDGSTTGPSALVVCSLYPYQCIRLPHGRYIFSVTAAPSEVKEEGVFKLNNDNFEQCYVDEHKVIEVLLSVLTVEEYITLGNDTEQIKSSSHRCNLGDVLRAGIKA